LLETSSQSEDYTRSYAPLKLQESQLWEVMHPQNGSPETKYHLDVAPMERRKEYYEGKGDGFPQVRVVMSLMSSKLPMVRCNNKNVRIMH
jgi:hypothetical protein